MNAKLYKGPFHGKNLAVHDYQNIIVLEKVKPGALATWLGDSSKPIERIRAYYRRTQHTHPNGSVFYEYAGS